MGWAGEVVADCDCAEARAVALALVLPDAAAMLSAGLSLPSRTCMHVYDSACVCCYEACMCAARLSARLSLPDRPRKGL